MSFLSLQLENNILFDKKWLDFVMYFLKKAGKLFSKIVATLKNGHFLGFLGRTSEYVISGLADPYVLVFRSKRSIKLILSHEQNPFF